ncbi:MAG: hypothetical protein MUP98_18080 [Candidatus Aminicenantes bacterium]|nr:hypothetical protein [Candidatus Aminicenantes bacterium]
MKHKSFTIKQHLFTCKKCSSHDVLVASLYKILEGHKRILPCKCGTSSSGIAAIQSYSFEKHYEDYGYLSQNHQWEFIHRNNLIDQKEVDQDFHLQCSKCFLLYEIDRQEWRSYFEKKALLEESVEFHVSCGGCGHEIEFGWSHPERAGDIWPVECVDFDPEKVWPEPRFRERWDQKGWIRSDFMFDTFCSETKIRSLLRKMNLKKAF